MLKEARALGRGSLLVFPSVRRKPLGSSAMLDLLRALKIAAVPHGFRSSFRDCAAEETDHPREVIEAALAHVVRNKVEAALAHAVGNRVEAAYTRSDLLERRREVMEAWAAYLAGRGAGT